MNKSVLFCSYREDPPQVHLLDETLRMPSLTHHLYLPISHDYDLGFVLHYEYKLPPEVIESFPLGIINFHPAPLPRYRGRNGVSHAILNGESEWCVTAHYIDTAFDTGPIITTEPCEIRPDDTALTLHNRTLYNLYRLFRRVVEDAALSPTRLPAIPQDGEQAIYWHKDSLASLHDCTGVTGEELYRRVRALTFPGKPKPYIVVDGHIIELSVRQA